MTNSIPKSHPLLLSSSLPWKATFCFHSGHPDTGCNLLISFPITPASQLLPFPKLPLPEALLTVWLSLQRHWLELLPPSEQTGLSEPGNGLHGLIVTTYVLNPTSYMFRILPKYCLPFLLVLILFLLLVILSLFGLFPSALQLTSPATPAFSVLQRGALRRKTIALCLLSSRSNSVRTRTL